MDVPVIEATVLEDLSEPSTGSAKQHASYPMRLSPLPAGGSLPTARNAGLKDWFMLHWDTALLLGVILAMVLMLANVLWPQPRAVITLKPLQQAEQTLALPVDSDEIPLPESESLDEALPGSSLANIETGTAASERRTVRSARHRHTSKKPEHPPVLNLNTAGSAQLQLLPGIGPKMADRVLEYRKANGPFAQPSDIMNVKGIGPKKFEKMQPYLKV